MLNYLRKSLAVGLVSLASCASQPNNIETKVENAPTTPTVVNSFWIRYAEVNGRLNTLNSGGVISGEDYREFTNIMSEIRNDEMPKEDRNNLLDGMDAIIESYQLQFESEELLKDLEKYGDLMDAISERVRIIGELGTGTRKLLPESQPAPK